MVNCIPLTTVGTIRSSLSSLFHIVCYVGGKFGKGQKKTVKAIFRIERSHMYIQIIFDAEQQVSYFVKFRLTNSTLPAKTQIWLFSISVQRLMRTVGGRSIKTSETGAPFIFLPFLFTPVLLSTLPTIVISFCLNMLRFLVFTLAIYANEEPPLIPPIPE